MMDWLHWGDGHANEAHRRPNLPDALTRIVEKPLPLLPILPHTEAAASRREDDVVVNGRQQWEMARSGFEHLPARRAQAHFPFTQPLRPQVLQATQPILSPRFGTDPKLLPEAFKQSQMVLSTPEIDAESGLELSGP